MSGIDFAELQYIFARYGPTSVEMKTALKQLGKSRISMQIYNPVTANEFIHFIVKSGGQYVTTNNNSYLLFNHSQQS